MTNHVIDTSLSHAFELCEKTSSVSIDYTTFSSFWLRMKPDLQEHWIIYKEAEVKKKEAAAADKENLVGGVTRKDVTEKKDKSPQL